MHLSEHAPCGLTLRLDHARRHSEIDTAAERRPCVKPTHRAWRGRHALRVSRGHTATMSSHKTPRQRDAGFIPSPLRTASRRAQRPVASVRLRACMAASTKRPAQPGRAFTGDAPGPVVRDRATVDARRPGRRNWPAAGPAVKRAMSPTSARIVNASTGPDPDEGVQRDRDRIRRGPLLRLERPPLARPRGSRDTAARGVADCGPPRAASCTCAQPRQRRRCVQPRPRRLPRIGSEQQRPDHLRQPRPQPHQLMPPAARPRASRESPAADM